jgi:hypothetical protein
MTNNEARTTVLLVLDETRRLASTGCEASAREVPALELALSLLEREPLVQAVLKAYDKWSSGMIDNDNEDTDAILEAVEALYNATPDE